MAAGRRGQPGENPGWPPLALAMDLSFAPYGVTGDADFVVAFSRRLNDLGLTASAIGIVDRALETDVPSARLDGARHRSGLSRLHCHRGELLRQAGELAAAETSFRTALGLLEGGTTRAGREGRAAVLNNLGLVHCERGDLSEAKRCLMASIEIDERLGTGRLELAVGFDNLGVIELRLAAAAGPRTARPPTSRAGRADEQATTPSVHSVAEACNS